MSALFRPRRAGGWALAVALVVLSGLAGAGGAAAAGPDGQSGTETGTVTTTDPSGRTVTLTHPRSVEPGADLVISGTGWQLGDASAGSLVNVLLDARFSGDPTTVHTRRTVLHPVTGKATGDTRSQALVRAAADGSWTARIPYPSAANARLADGSWTDWAPGSEHEVRVLTGSLLAGDVTRSLAGTFTVAGGDGTDDTDGTGDPDGDTGGDPGDDTDGGTGPDDATTCRPTSPRPTVRVETSVVALGGELEISGAGWCHPQGGGSRIGVKIDEGALARTDDTVHANRTIWAIVQADARTGTFRTRLRLPDGTTATSTPALTTGAHTLRLLSGTLHTGDTLRSVLSEPFSVGRYRPAGTPEPLEASADLRPGTRGAVAARVVGDDLRLRVPRARAQEWVFVTAYAADGSPRYPWVRWFRLDDARRVVLPGAGRLPAGRLRVSVQSGEQDRIGRLLGWAPLTVPAEPAGPAVPHGPAAPAGGGPAPGTDPVAAGTPALEALSPVPAGPRVTPAAPAADAAALRELPRGGGRVDVDGSALRVLVPGARPGEAVHVRVYPVGADPVRVLSGGWVLLDADSALRVRVRGLAGTEFLVAVQAGDGRLLGWAPATPDGPGGPTYVEQTIPAAILDEDAASQVAGEATDDRSWFTAADAGLLALGALALTGAVLRTRRGTVTA